MTQPSGKYVVLHICTFDVEMIYDFKARVGNEPGERLGGLGSSYLSGGRGAPPQFCNMKVEPLRRSCSPSLSFRNLKFGNWKKKEGQACQLYKTRKRLDGAFFSK